MPGLHALAGGPWQQKVMMRRVCTRVRCRRVQVYDALREAWKEEEPTFDFEECEDAAEGEETWDVGYRSHLANGRTADEPHVVLAEQGAEYLRLRLINGKSPPPPPRNPSHSAARCCAARATPLPVNVREMSVGVSNWNGCERSDQKRRSFKGNASWHTLSPRTAPAPWLVSVPRAINVLRCSTMWANIHAAAAPHRRLFAA